MKKIIVFAGLFLQTLTSCGVDNLGEKGEKKPFIAQNSTPKADFSQLEEGDLIFQVSLSEQSKAIQAATKSRYSHVGILYKQDEGKVWQVLEAVSTVRLTPIDEFIKNGENQHFVVKRLKQSRLYLGETNLRNMHKIGKSFLGKPYDLQFLWGDDKMYCSELVWKIYQRGQASGLEIGKLQPLKNFNLDDPAVQAKLGERYGVKIPYNEPMISPGDMFNSDLLITILEK